MIANPTRSPDYAFFTGANMTVQSDRPIDITEVKASGGVKLGSVRYVLAVGLMLAAVAGVVIWNIFAK
jgi:hypothetical protein